MIAASYYAKGIVNAVCQDSYALEVIEKGKTEGALLLVCDGIGGLQEGEYASRFVTDYMKAWFYERVAGCIKSRIAKAKTKRLIRPCVRALYECHVTLTQHGLHNNIKLGTTMTLVLVIKRRFFLFHVGDSRAYIVGKKGRCITKDDIYKHNVLSKCIGSFPWRGVCIEKGKLKKGQGILVCSDGIYKAFLEEELLAVFDTAKPFTERKLRKRLDRLAWEARQRGSIDDQTAVVVYLERKRNGSNNIQG
ncbi:MAG: serine/threonine-protein phosphatase [Lachnospiraceae bacterium]|nr:serine/threonine-protein phosphatase [Lachnospiraceae bacterium]